MPIVGNLIKTALDLNSKLRHLPEDAHQVQMEQLEGLLEKSKSTS